METFFILMALCEGKPLVVGGFPHKEQVVESFDICLMLAWTNFSTNIRVASDLQCHDTHVASL